ncbi:peptidase S16 [Modestobacter sp. I12A-02628]|uniref:LON peptidase substrate-binding domain-containing protein n=1 Tax=Goekera deserti TaxID=2497753 RepID=A0A7K3WBM7_9ACTN|nr:LON peptidase substrate-binding domain-containing protein [Goekera deserti]MPQ99253.1 peptidase S16 [Goekera deserti]NDI47588.1 peptidase S16 [Goekera deserti]NEL53399.1 LON peptidase substrate-binding domain-containing protein [Goekera deserti]
MGDLIPLFPLGSPLFPGVVLPLQVFEPRYRRLVADLVALPAGSDRRFFGVVAIRQGWEVERVAPAEALFDIGTTALLRAVTPQPDGGFRIVTVGGDRFRLLDVHVADDPPYLQADVEWLADEEAAEEAAGDSEGLQAPAVPGGDPEGSESAEVARSVARGSMGLLARNVRDLFARYATEVALLQGGVLDESDVDPTLDAALAPGAQLGLDGEDGPGLDPETAALLRQVSHDARGLSYLVASAALLTTEDRQALLAESATRRRLASEVRLLRRELMLLRELGAVPVPLHQFAGPLTPN